MKESRHDHFLRKFEYSKALDQVLKLYVQKRYPEYTYSVLRELKRYNHGFFIVCLAHFHLPYLPTLHPIWKFIELFWFLSDFRRKGLKTAVGGRDEKSLCLLLQYLSKYINDPRFSQLLMEVVDVVLGKD